MLASDSTPKAKKSPKLKKKVSKLKESESKK